jgi:hypothetical protein
VREGSLLGGEDHVGRVVRRVVAGIRPAGKGVMDERPSSGVDLFLSEDRMWLIQATGFINFEP